MRFAVLWHQYFTVCFSKYFVHNFDLVAAVYWQFYDMYADIFENMLPINFE